MNIYSVPLLSLDRQLDSTVKESSVIAVQISDQRKFKRRDRGFLGVVKVRVGDVLDWDIGGHEIMTLDLKMPDDTLLVHSKLIIHLSIVVS